MIVSEYCSNCDKKTMRNTEPCPECIPIDVRMNKEYLRRGLIHSKACGVEAGLTCALFKVAKLKSHPKWLVKLLQETMDKSEGIRQELAEHRDEVKH